MQQKPASQVNPIPRYKFSKLQQNFEPSSQVTVLWSTFLTPSSRACQDLSFELPHDRFWRTVQKLQVFLTCNAIYRVHQKIIDRKCWITSEQFDGKMSFFFCWHRLFSHKSNSSRKSDVSKKNFFCAKNFFLPCIYEFTPIKKAIITRVECNKNQLPKSNRFRDTNVQSWKKFFSHPVFLGFFNFPRLHVVLHNTSRLPVTIGCVSPAFLFIF